LEIFCGGFYQKDLKFHTFTVFVGKMLLQKLYFPQTISTEARIHQKSAAWKCAAHFTVVNSAYLELLKSST